MLKRIVLCLFLPLAVIIVPVSSPLLVAQEEKTLFDALQAKAAAEEIIDEASNDAIAALSYYRRVKEARERATGDPMDFEAIDEELATSSAAVGCEVTNEPRGAAWEDLLLAIDVKTDADQFLGAGEYDTAYWEYEYAAGWAESSMFFSAEAGHALTNGEPVNPGDDWWGSTNEAELLLNELN